MKTNRLYHNAGCSKSRGALEFLHARGVPVEVVSYLEHPPSVEELRDLVKLLDQPARALLRESEPEARRLGLDDPGCTCEQILEALHAHPGLLQRPIFVSGARAVIARPAERMLELLDAEPGPAAS